MLSSFNILNPKNGKLRRWLTVQAEAEEFTPPKTGTLFIQFLIALFFLVFVVRFWYLQVHKGAEFSQRALENRLREERIIALRGLITDKNGEILADNVLTYGLTIVREDCPDIPATLAQVSEWTGINHEKLVKKYYKDRRKTHSFDPVLLATDLDIALVAKIEAQLLYWPGIEIVARAKRTYPKGEIYAHILGYVAEASEKEMQEDEGLNMGDLVGKQGLELVLENNLRGQKGLYQLEVDVLGRSLSKKMVRSPRGGSETRLTLDSSIQIAAWNALEGQTGSIVVMDPDTGKLVALVTAPAYDNNLFTDGISHKEWDALRLNQRFPLQNRVIQSMYPPASVWKLLMASLLLQENINPSEKVFCSGETQLGNQTFRCWKKGGHGNVNMAESLMQSCDIYYYHFGEKVGIDKIEEYARKNGFGDTTGIILPHEKDGLVPSKKWKERRFNQPWVTGETLNISIGQGYTLVTPLQVATYVSAIINGGDLLQPQILESAQRVVQRQIPASAAEREFIIDSMRKTVTQGTAKVMNRIDADMGGKTGTAQVVKLQMKDDEVIKNEDLEYAQRDHAWIATWGAKDAKRYVVVVMVEHGGSGSSVAGPVAKKIYDALFGEQKKISAEKKVASNPIQTMKTNLEVANVTP